MGLPEQAVKHGQGANEQEDREHGERFPPGGADSLRRPAIGFVGPTLVVDHVRHRCVLRIIPSPLDARICSLAAGPSNNL